MEKRNVIERGRTPEIEKQATVDAAEDTAIALFDKSADATEPDESANPED